MKYIIEINDTTKVAKTILSFLKGVSKTTKSITVKSEKKLQKEYDDWFIATCESSKKSGTIDTKKFLDGLG